ncbi:MAG: hypothetical protein PWP38_2435 [Clostridiales bacterium]|nr:hypothetical protein [Clostridiales bacterium]
MKYRLLSSMFYEDTELYKNTYETRYNSESTYRYKFSIGDHKAFVVINNNILKLISKILVLDKDFALKAQHLPSIALKQYTKKCIIDEIKMTNDIEGVISTRKEINEILEDLTGRKKTNRLYGLVKKYELLTEEELALSNCADIRALYNELVLSEIKADNIDHVPDGTIFRKDPVYVQSKTGKTIHSGINPERKIIETMTDCLLILHDENYSRLISIAVFHYMFGYIHPFYDGNGRISRFISSYLLSRELHPLIAYRLAYTIKNDINSYYKSFKVVNDEKNKGEITSFVEYFFSVLAESLEDLNASLLERINKLNFYKNQISIMSQLDNHIDERINKILYILVQNSLFGEHGLGVAEISEITDIGDSKVRTSLKLLETKSLIKQNRIGRKYIYEADLDFINDIRR